MNPGAIFSALFAVILGLLLIYTVSEVAYDCAIRLLLHQSGANIDAEIVDLRWKIRRSIVYYVAYRFTLPIGHFNHEQPVVKRHYKNLGINQNVSVRYLPKHPHISRLAGTDKDNFHSNAGIYFNIFVYVLLPPLILLWLIIFAVTVLIKSH